MQVIVKRTEPEGSMAPVQIAFAIGTAKEIANREAQVEKQQARAKRKGEVVIREVCIPIADLYRPLTQMSAVVREVWGLAESKFVRKDKPFFAPCNYGAWSERQFRKAKADDLDAFLSDHFHFCVTYLEASLGVLSTLGSILDKLSVIRWIVAPDITQYVAHINREGETIAVPIRSTDVPYSFRWTCARLGIDHERLDSALMAELCALAKERGGVFEDMRAGLGQEKKIVVKKRSHDDEAELEVTDGKTPASNFDQAFLAVDERLADEPVIAQD